MVLGYSGCAGRHVPAAFEGEMDVYRLLGFDADAIGGVIPSPREILLRHVGRPDPVIFDVGASVGQSVERFRALFERPVIHAFEPESVSFEALQQRFGGLESVVLNCLALGDSTGTATLRRSNFHESSSLLALDAGSSWAQSLDLREADSALVRIDTIDHYCAERAIATIDLLKVDVQGFEPECLRGAAAMLADKRIRAIQLEIILHPLYVRPMRFTDVETVLSPHGYRLFTIFDLAVASTGELLQLDGLFVPA
jgi:FkbM family methyltransferase